MIPVTQKRERPNAIDQKEPAAKRSNLSDRVQGAASEALQPDLTERGIKFLRKHNFATEKNIKTLHRCPEYALKLAKGILILHENKILTKSNRKNLRQYAKYAEPLAEAIAKDHENTKTLRTLRLNSWRIHSKENETKAALTQLKNDQGLLTSAAINRAVQAFTDYLQQQEDTQKKSDALYALSGEVGVREFPPLLGPQRAWSISDFRITGEELIARLWIFIESQAFDKTNAKLSMFHSLANSVENESRVCNPGKTVRLVIGTLQGNMPGVKIDQIEEVEIVSAQKAAQLFFLNKSHRKIKDIDTLITTGIQWVFESPNVVDRMGFLNELREYAAHSL